MTSIDLIKLKFIETLLATIDMDDEDDQKQAMRQILALVGADKQF